MNLHRKSGHNFCAFCQPDEYSDGITPATTIILNPAIGRPLPACQDCRDLWDEQNYNDAQAYAADPERVMGVER